MQNVKCVLVGDGVVGKMCLAQTFVTDIFPEGYIPTVHEILKTTLTVDEKPYELALWVTAGQEDYDRLRPLSYKDTNVFLLCFSITQRTSFVNVDSNWIHELRHYCPKVPIVLVGTKLDLRGKNVQGENEPTTYEDGLALAKKIGAVKYVECSALERKGLQEVFEVVVRAAFNLKKSKCCVIC